MEFWDYPKTVTPTSNKASNGVTVLSQLSPSKRLKRNGHSGFCYLYGSGGSIFAFSSSTEYGGDLRWSIA